VITIANVQTAYALTVYTAQIIVIQTCHLFALSLLFIHSSHFIACYKNVYLDKRLSKTMTSFYCFRIFKFLNTQMQNSSSLNF